jgi:hypothetical protein
MSRLAQLRAQVNDLRDDMKTASVSERKEIKALYDRTVALVKAYEDTSAPPLDVPDMDPLADDLSVQLDTDALDDILTSLSNETTDMDMVEEIGITPVGVDEFTPEEAIVAAKHLRASTEYLRDQNRALRSQIRAEKLTPEEVKALQKAGLMATSKKTAPAKAAPAKPTVQAGTTLRASTVASKTAVFCTKWSKITPRSLKASTGQKVSAAYFRYTYDRAGKYTGGQWSTHDDANKGNLRVISPTALERLQASSKKK